MQKEIRSILEQIGEDPTREGLLKTPERVEKSYQFLKNYLKESTKSLIALFTVFISL